MADLKETIISSMVNGPDVLQDIVSARRNGRDYVTDRFHTKTIVNRLHPDKLSLRVSEIRTAASGAKTFRFVSCGGALPYFEAGQYLNVFTEIDGVRTSRPYSISSSPKQRGYYEITVARIPAGFVSDYFLDKVKVGDTFEANGPAGVFHYNPVFHKKRSVFLAGGSGITPFMSMISEALESGAERDITLIYGVRNEDAAIFKDELISFEKTYKNFRFHLVLSEAPEGYSGRRGFIDEACIRELAGNTDDCTFYLCGPQVMTDFCYEALCKLKVSKNHIRREMFGSRQDIQNEPGWPANLTGNEVFKLKVGDRTIDALSRESILTALERAGIRVNVCCRSGECSYCRVRLVSGKVFMPRGVLLRLADEKFGFIHSCKAYPMEDLEIEF